MHDVYIYSSFPKLDKHHSKKWAYYAKVKFIHCVFEKGFSHMLIYVYIFMKSSFPKHYLRTWHRHCNLDFWISAYCILEKSFSYIYILYIYTIVYTYIQFRYIYIYTMTSCICISIQTAVSVFAVELYSHASVYYYCHVTKQKALVH